MCSELREKLFMTIVKYGRNTQHSTDETFSCVNEILSIFATDLSETFNRLLNEVTDEKR